MRGGRGSPARSWTGCSGLGTRVDPSEIMPFESVKGHCERRLHPEIPIWQRLLWAAVRICPLAAREDGASKRHVLLGGRVMEDCPHDCYAISCRSVAAC